MLTEKERLHVSRIIEREVSYFNTWSVSQQSVSSDCLDAAKKIEKYISKKISEKNRSV